jgi:molybdopterin-guanine dinucleotide biosynthesis protein A
LTFDGIVLAGGFGRRLGGTTKPLLTVGDRTLLDVAVAALDGAASTIVVGAPLPTARPVTWTRESPPGGGPVAALAAALRVAAAPVVVVLAADLPFVTADAVAQLVAARRETSAAVAVDEDGHEQPLLACYVSDLLRDAMPHQPSGAAMRPLLGRLRSTGSVTQVRLGGNPPATVDCDTTADLSRIRELA